jgi:circadian clock protein KaiB
MAMVKGGNVKRKKPIDDAKAFEKALGKPSPTGRYLLRLYISGSTPKSARAITNIRAICEEKLAGRYELEVIDIYQHPEEVKADQIVVTPTLVKSLPMPVRKLIGDLSNRERVLVGLDVIPKPASEQPARGGGEHGSRRS